MFAQIPILLGCDCYLCAPSTFCVLLLLLLLLLLLIIIIIIIIIIMLMLLLLLLIRIDCNAFCFRFILALVLHFLFTICQCQLSSDVIFLRPLRVTEKPMVCWCAIKKLLTHSFTITTTKKRLASCLSMSLHVKKLTVTLTPSIIPLFYVVFLVYHVTPWRSKLHRFLKVLYNLISNSTCLWVWLLGIHS